MFRELAGRGLQCNIKEVGDIIKKMKQKNSFIRTELLRMVTALQIPDRLARGMRGEAEPRLGLYSELERDI